MYFHFDPIFKINLPNHYPLRLNLNLANVKRLRIVNLHNFVRMGPKLKYILRLNHLYNCNDRVLPLSRVSPIEAASLTSKRPQQLMITKQRPVNRRSLMDMVG